MVTEEDKEELFKETVNFLNGLDCDSIRLKGLYLHLILEGYLNQAIEKNIEQPKKILDSDSFYKKMKALKRNGVIDETTFQNLKIVNNVRDIMAHDLYVLGSVIEKELNKIKFSEGTTLSNLNGVDKTNHLMTLIFIDIYEKLKTKIP